MTKQSPFTGVLADVMCRHVSPDRADLLSESTGIHERTIHALRRGESGAWFEHTLLPILAELGPAAINDILAYLGMGGVHYVDAKQCLRDVHVTVSRLDAKLTELGADGVYDSRDQTLLRPLLGEAAPKIAAAAGRKVA